MTSPSPIGQRMHALVVKSHRGAAASLAHEELPVPELRSGQVLIRVAASPINPNDLLALRNAYDVPKAVGRVAGFEGSGTVVAGNGAMAKAMVGRRVAFAAADDSGTWAQFAVAQWDRCVPLRGFVTDEEGATMLTNPLTATVLVERAKKEGHAAVVQAAAAGALGKMVARLAIERKLPMVHLVRSDAQVASLKALGAEHVLDTSKPGYESELAVLCGRLKATLALDPVGGPMTGTLLHALQDKGVVRVFGSLSGAPISLDTNDVVFKGKRVEGFTMYQWLTTTSMPGQIATVMKAQGQLRGALSTEVRSRVPLKDFQAALSDYEKQMSGGKILFVPSQAA